MMQQPQLNKEAMCELAKKLTDLLMSYDRATAMHTLMIGLPIFWCNGNFTTVTEAVDTWRLASQDVEDSIRKCFGGIRYGD